LTATILVALGGLAFALPAAAAPTKDQQRADLRKNADETLQQL